MAKNKTTDELAEIINNAEPFDRKTEEVKIKFTVTLPIEAQKESEEERMTKSRSRLINQAAHRLAEFTQTKYDSDIDAIDVGEHTSEIKEYTLENGVNIRWDFYE